MRTVVEHGLRQEPRISVDKYGRDRVAVTLKGDGLFLVLDFPDVGHIKNLGNTISEEAGKFLKKEGQNEG